MFKYIALLAVAALAVVRATPINVDCSTDHASDNPWTIVDNAGGNFITIRTCDQSTTCVGQSGPLGYKECPLQIPPNTQAQVFVNKNVTYFVGLYCVHNPLSIHCLVDPTPVEVYRPFPAKVALPYASPSTTYCSKGVDCPDSVCNYTQDPPVCGSS